MRRESSLENRKCSSPLEGKGWAAAGEIEDTENLERRADWILFFGSYYIKFLKEGKEKSLIARLQWFQEG